jgi:hypothetical protein
MAYTPPSSPSFNFTATYTPPTQPVALNLAEDNTVIPTGIAPEPVGTPALIFRQFIAVAGIPTSGVGEPAVSNATLFLDGIAPGSTGTPTIYLNARLLVPGGIAHPPQTGTNSARQLPSPRIAYRTQILEPTGRAPPFIFAPTVTHEYQYLALTGIPPKTVGSAVVTHLVRYIEPPSIISYAFGTASLVRAEILPSGWASSIVPSAHSIRTNEQRVQQSGVVIDPAGYGVLEVHNVLTRVYPEGIAPATFVPPIVHNLRQYVLTPTYADNSSPTTWPIYSPIVRNRNQELPTTGFISSRFHPTGTWIHNAAEPIAPLGLDATQWGVTDVAHFHRSIFPTSIDVPYWTIWTHVRNTGQVVAVTGIPSTSSYGNAFVYNSRLICFPQAVVSSSELGIPFIADRVRSITLFPWPYSPPIPPAPAIRLNPNPISPAGLEPPFFGLVYVIERFNILAPPAANIQEPRWFGTPEVVNRNKVLRPYADDQSAMGLARVNNYTTYIELGMGSMTRFGSTVISPRTRVVTAIGANPPVFTTVHRVRNDLPDLPVVQRIFGAGFIGATGQPELSLLGIYPFGIYESAVSAPRVAGNRITPTSIFDMGLMGIPSLIATQYLYPRPIPDNSAGGDAGESDLQWGVVRVSPHTIYAPSGDQATEQARRNHPSGIPQVIDYGIIKYGLPSIGNKHRIIGPVPFNGTPSSRYGTPILYLRQQHIFVDGVRPGRLGFAEILGGTLTVDLNDPSVGIAAPAFDSLHQIGPPYEAPTPILYPVGMQPPTISRPRVEPFHREVAPPGTPHRGNPQQNLTNPWGTAVINHWIPPIVGGYNFTQWGTPFISHRIRAVYVPGHDALTIAEYGLGAFRNRMRVTRRNPLTIVPSILPGAVGSGTVVGFRVRTVGAHSALQLPLGIPKVSMVIYPTGWDSTIFGDIDRWEAGKIKPYGSELSSYGIPRMSHTISPSGEDVLSHGTPRMAWSVIMSGIPPIGFDGPALTDISGCNNRVVVPLPVLALSISSPTVGHV